MPDPHEALPQTNNEMEQLVRIDRMLGDYFPEDIAFVPKQLADEDDILSFLYGQLFDIGEDPDEVLARYGIIEG